MKCNAFCEDLRFSAAINTIATAIAAQFETPEAQTAAAAILNQIAYTVETIAARNVLCRLESEEEKTKSEKQQ
ncbi:hypothetical protein [Ruminococcus sp.]|uniref:hypothetical protein n=1 Tax=Ruminococcus sp. TaxID=41978 RepID=UPI0025F2CF24|nr:hypothetical protein [Ruminococcus sp.]